MSDHTGDCWGCWDSFERSIESFTTDWTTAYPSLDLNSPSITSLGSDLDTLNQDWIDRWGDLGNFSFGDGQYTSTDDPLDGFKALPNWQLSKSMIAAGIEFREDRFSWGICAGYFPAGSRGDGRDPYSARNSWGQMPYIPGSGTSVTTEAYFMDGGRNGDIYVPGGTTFGDSATLMIWVEWR